ncbi:hypothetical protein Pcac1_g6925 [Phytophthora cactorum]|nr:hypothetical protein Pcac1_g6925 [Phytophthora cactorum]
MHLERGLSDTERNLTWLGFRHRERSSEATFTVRAVPLATPERRSRPTEHPKFPALQSNSPVWSVYSAPGEHQQPLQHCQ